MEATKNTKHIEVPFLSSKERDDTSETASSEALENIGVRALSEDWTLGNGFESTTVPKKQIIDEKAYFTDDLEFDFGDDMEVSDQEQDTAAQGGALNASFRVLAQHLAEKEKSLTPRRSSRKKVVEQSGAMQQQSSSDDTKKASYRGLLQSPGSLRRTSRTLRRSTDPSNLTSPLNRSRKALSERSNRRASIGENGDSSKRRPKAAVEPPSSPQVTRRLRDQSRSTSRPKSLRRSGHDRSNGSRNNEQDEAIDASTTKPPQQPPLSAERPRSRTRSTQRSADKLVAEVPAPPLEHSRSPRVRRASSRGSRRSSATSKPEDEVSAEEMALRTRRRGSRRMYKAGHAESDEADITGSRHSRGSSSAHERTSVRMNSMDETKSPRSRRKSLQSPRANTGRSIAGKIVANNKCEIPEVERTPSRSGRRLKSFDLASPPLSGPGRRRKSVEQTGSLSARSSRRTLDPRRESTDSFMGLLQKLRDPSCRNLMEPNKMNDGDAPDFHLLSAASPASRRSLLTRFNRAPKSIMLDD